MEKKEIQLCPKESCTGCFACAGVCGRNAITLIESSEGFLYPEIDTRVCVSCHLCQKTCPVLSPVSVNPEGKCYAAWSLDKAIRTHSSSGGVFSELARCIILQKGIVVGASLDDTTGCVNHIIIDKVAELHKIQGSKYVQSKVSAEILKQVKESLRNERKVLFTGTPCQIAGIIAFTKNPSNLYTMDVVCHGVPSPKWFQEIHKTVRGRIKGFVNYNFRQLFTWSVCTNVNVNVNVNGKIKNYELFGIETCYQDAFLKGYLHRENCYHCHYADKRRVADISVADFWGIGSKKPITDEHKSGCSMVLVNSDKGRQLFEAVRNWVYAEIRDVSETIEAGNEQLRNPSNRPQERDTFYVDAYSLSLQQLVMKYKLDYKKMPPLTVRIKSRVKSIIKSLMKWERKYH